MDELLSLIPADFAKLVVPAGIAANALAGLVKRYLPSIKGGPVQLVALAGSAVSVIGLAISSGAFARSPSMAETIVALVMATVASWTISMGTHEAISNRTKTEEASE